MSSRETGGSARITAVRRLRRGDGEADQPVPHLIVAATALAKESATAQLIPLPDALIVGRQLPADGKHLTFEDPLVSRRHALICSEGAGQVTIRDLDSSNGTFVDGRRVSGVVTLQDGAIIFLGDNVLIYRALTAEAGQALQAGAAKELLGWPTLSAGMARVCERLRAVAPTDLEVLLSGESGVGKEVCARAIHAASGRAGPFVAINCASLPEELLESELFGYARGAHSTATQPKAGLIEQADGGTLFLDEIGDMSSRAQAKLLRFLQDRWFVPLGSASPRRSQARVIAATRFGSSHEEGHGAGLRVDLAARLGPDPVIIPPLRSRKEDLALLTSALLHEQTTGLMPDALKLLFLYDWPANVRELAKTLQLASALAGGAIIAPEHLPDRLRTPGAAPAGAPAVTPSAEALLQARRRKPRPSPDVLLNLLREHQGDVAAVARALGRQRTLVWRWLRADGVLANEPTDKGV